MKKLLFLVFVALSITAKAQVSTVLLSTGIPAFVGSSIYYAIGEPVYNTATHSQATYDAYTKALTRYRNTRTIAMIGSSTLLISGVILKAAEIKTSKHTSLNLSPTGAQFTLTW
jgi:uncharacterized oligopeptide transporter (OPT) family protein